MSIKKMQNVLFHFLVIFVLIAGCNDDVFAAIQPPGNLHIGTVLSNAADQLNAGQSIKFTTNNLTTTLAATGDIMAYIQSGFYDATDKAVSMIGHQHGGQYVNHRLYYDEATNTWSDSTNLHSTLMSPALNHAYDFNAYDTATGDIYYKQYNSSTLYWYDKSADTWSTPTTIPGSLDIAEALEYWQGRGVVYSDVYGVKLWDGSSWSTLDNTVRSVGYHSLGEYQQDADLYVYGGGNNGEQTLFKMDSSNTVTALSTPPSNVVFGNSPTQGLLIRDPASTKMIAWGHGTTKAWAELDPVNDTWTSLSVVTGDGSTPENGTPNITEPQTFGVPIDAYGVIMYVSNSTDDVWLYKHTNNANTSGATVPTNDYLQSFKLTSGLSGEVPFTTGLAFKEGDVPGIPTLDLDNYQVEVKRTWPDGSAKHAVVSGTYNSSAGSPYTINVFGSGVVPSGIDLTEADIIAAGPSASIQVGSYGTVYLSSLLGSPQRIWTSGPEMIEAHYYSSLSYSPYIAVKFHVRLYKSGKMFVRTVVENGNLSSETSSNITYAPTIIIGGSTVFDNGGSSLTHYAHQRYDVTGWIGTNNPETVVAHDTLYLIDTGLVPNYWKTGPSQTALSTLTQNYSPLQRGDWTANMGNSGFQTQIGLIPNWDALYINSFGNSSAYKSVIANTRSINSYPLIWPDPNTEDPIVISSRPTYTVNGAGGGGATEISAGTLTWDVAHHGSAGYLAYLITGDYYYLETMEYQAALTYLVVSSSEGSGTSRKLVPVQTRGVAWATRTVGQLAGIAPSDSISDDFVSLLSNTMTYWKSVIDQPGMNTIGYFYEYSANSPSFPYGSGAGSPWMQHFWAQTLGYISDLKPLPDMSTFDAVRDHLYIAVVGILGANGSANYCFTKASNYNLEFSAIDNVSDPTVWHDTWGEVYYGTHGSYNTTCANTLEGNSGGAPSIAATGYWGNLLPAIAYAVEDGATGASDAWTRLTGATNFSDIENSGFEDIPIWGVWPR